MNPEALFLYMIAAAALVLAFTNLFLLSIKKGKTAVTTGTVISISMPNPDTAAWNSKWATVTYKIHDKNYISRNQVQVPRASQVGSKVTVRYNKQQPDQLYSFSLTRSAIALAVAFVCAVLAFFV